MRSRYAFTIVELLVVISIIGIMVRFVAACGATDTRAGAANEL